MARANTALRSPAAVRRAVSLAAMLVAILATLASRSSTALARDEAGQEQGGWILAFPADLEEKLRGYGVPIWSRDGEIVIAGADDARLDSLAADSVAPILKLRDTGQELYLMIHDEQFVAPPFAQAEVYTLTPTSQLWVFPPGLTHDLPRVKPYGGFMGVPRIGMPPVEPHPADLARPLVPDAPNPLVTQIVNATSQANWFQYVKDLSGENPVFVAGQNRTILTRWTASMFPVVAPNAYATEYLEEKAAGWGYSSVREPYTSANDGCVSAHGGNTWQNLVITIPGQVDFGQHQQVIFVTHYDSLSFSNAESASYAPGADDAMSGGSALIEALRLFKDYGFKNTVKFVFFSGEEEGLCGSVAYTRIHTNYSDMWRVVNMDQTAYDGNRNGWMDVYNWSLASSPQSVALGDSFVQANTDYGTIINPANIFRPTNKMCQTDHCPFWNVGVAAIAVTEDLFHNEICPCFDQTQTSTCHDTVTQIDPTHPGQLMFDQNYSWPSEKAAIATVAHLAEPLYACPLSAPTPAIAPGNNILHVSWPTAAGVTNYVLEKAASCAGPFAPITSETDTSYDDIAVVNGASYAYRIRTCPTQVSACVTAAPVAGPSVIYQTGSAVVTSDSGDHDAIADNCELVTVSVNLLNDGNAMLTNVKLSDVTSSATGVEVVSTLPQNVGSLVAGATAPASFRFYLGRTGSPAACGDSLPFMVTATSDQAPASARSFTLGSEKDSAGGPLSYGFETNFSGWTVTTGSFTRVAGGAPGSTAFSLHSRNANSICDAVESPIVVPTGTSTMTMWVNYSIEAGNFDRAVVRAIDTTTGVKTLLVPTVAPYTTAGCGGVTLCENLCNIQGWSGSATTWRQASFNLAAFAGIPIKIEVRFSTDTSALGTQGFWFDAVQITNAAQISCDAQSNTCGAIPAEVSPVGNPVQFTLMPSGVSLDLRFSEVAGATAYHVHGGSLASLHAGTYTHGPIGALCGFTDGTTGDGQVTASVGAGSVPNGSYLLAVASNAAGESIPGTTSGGSPIPLAPASCP